MILVLPKYMHPYSLRDILIAISGIFKDYIEEDTLKIKKYFKKSHIVLFDSGRSALNQILKYLNIEKDCEVAIPVNICEVVPNIITKNNLRPILIDIDDNLCISVKDLKKKLTKNTRVIIIVHTFGNVANIKKIKKIVEKRNIITIEDCAQTFNAKLNKEPVGTFSDYSFISLDITKHISSIKGGILITKDRKFYKKLVETLPKPKIGLKKLFELISFMVLTNRLVYNLITKFIVKKKKSSILLYEPKNQRLDKVSTAILYSQLDKLIKINKYKKLIAETIISKLDNNTKVYCDKDNNFPSYLFLPIGVKNKHLVENLLSRIIDLPQPPPLLTHFKKYKIYKQPCPNAEKIQKRLILLPTYSKIYKYTSLIAKTIKNYQG